MKYNIYGGSILFDWFSLLALECFLALKGMFSSVRCFCHALLQLIIACRKGGTSIEDLAEKFPDMIIKVLAYFTLTVSSFHAVLVFTYMVVWSSARVPIDVFKGITDEDAAKVVDGLAPMVADRNASIEQVKKLYKLFCETDCTLLEVSISGCLFNPCSGLMIDDCLWFLKIFSPIF